MLALGVCRTSTLGERLRKLRSAKGMNQEAVAAILGISRATYANWEINRTSPDPETIRRLADILSTSADHLLGRTTNPDDTFLGIESIVEKIAKAEGMSQTVVDEALRRITEAREALDRGRAEEAHLKSVSPMPLWVSKLPPDMQEFVREESQYGWPYLRLARGLKMQDLTKEELEAIVETWMDAKKRHEREFGPDRKIDPPHR